jgi:hypothetical protein
METSRLKQIERAATVWVWDGSWWPAVVTNALVDRGERLLIVRFEHGLTAPARPANLEPRDPDLCGADKPCPAVA